MSSWNHTVTTRKPCQCWGCNQEVPAGTRVRNCTEKDGGRFVHTRWCPVCDVLWSRYGDEYDDGIGLGDFRLADEGAEWEAIRQELAEAT